MPKKKWEFEVFDDGERLWCLRPTSWIAGMGRDSVIRKITGRKTGIMSPNWWDKNKSRAQVLVLFDDGTWALEKKV